MQDPPAPTNMTPFRLALAVSEGRSVPASSRGADGAASRMGEPLRSRAGEFLNASRTLQGATSKKHSCSGSG